MRLHPTFLVIAALSIWGIRSFGAPLPPIPLWQNGAPGALGTSEFDIPTATAFLPDPAKATGAAILVFPGGGYGSLAPYEGEEYAKWLAENGIAGIVIKYRLGTHGYRHPTMLQDAARSVRLARSKATEWKIDPKRVGVIGSSAGGHLASTIVTHFDLGNAADPDPVEHESSRPDFGVLCYPVITMTDPLTHSGSRENLLGKNPSQELIDYLSSEKQVTAQTSPCFVWHTYEDTLSCENSMLFAEALRKARVPFELHIYEKGPHGIALSQGKNGVPANDVHPWAHDLLFWLKGRGVLPK